MPRPPGDFWGSEDCHNGWGRECLVITATCPRYPNPASVAPGIHYGGRFPDTTAYTTVLYENRIWAFDGENELEWLNIVWGSRHRQLSGRDNVVILGCKRPSLRGYYNMMIAIGGSDGREYLWNLNHGASRR